MRYAGEFLFYHLHIIILLTFYLAEISLNTDVSRSQKIQLVESLQV